MKWFRTIATTVLGAGMIVSMSAIAPQAQAASTSVMIVEVYNATANGDEWVALANVGSTEADLSGWALQDYSGSGNAQAKWYFPSGTKMPASSLLVIEKTAGNSGSAAKGVAALTGGSFNFAGSSDRIDLINASNALVDGIAWGTPNTVEGFSINSSSTSGTSFERQTATDTDAAADWLAVTSNVQAYAWSPLPGQTSNAPIVQTVSPAEGAVNVPIGSDLTVTFDKDITVGEGVLTVVNVTDSLTFATIDVEAPEVAITGSTLQVSLNDLQPGKKYEVTMPAGYVLDDATFNNGNGLKKWSFTTAPQLSASLSSVRSAAIGSIVAVRGEVTAVLGSHNAWIQDATAGIRMYQPSGIGTLTAGQEVIVTGTVKNYNNDLELELSSIEVQSSNTIPTPQPAVTAVNLVGEANEGSLVKVENVWVKADYNTGAGGVIVTDGTNDLVVYAQAGSSMKAHLQALPKSSSSKFDMVGVSSVYNSTIELLPRTNADIVAK
ncbi:lamin tail domain-containing protein [Paenibacillus sp. YYML68]|uniref:lamin tail domain-containing protein n=1 Tax=Paenibacillus sp. YYML68 TaxID=2909250 RepID=UPI00249110B7|nr:lamin tail domain-containing protein [Paenibacillus sp. YYML68]